MSELPICVLTARRATAVAHEPPRDARQATSPAARRRHASPRSLARARARSTVRCLCADIVEKSNSGHPGAPMGLAPVAHVLWSKIMRFSPADPKVRAAYLGE